jgi:transcription elongation factor GreB
LAAGQFAPSDLSLENLLPNDKKASSLRYWPLSLLVRLAGIEPTTPWFVAKYSIQLSYSREASDYRAIQT